MNETVVTLQGWLGGEVTVRQAGDSVVANFRVATTPRRYQKKTDTWVDGDTQWYTVNAWRALAENCQRSLRRGDPVVVHGKLNAQVWTNSAGMEVTSFEVEATLRRPRSQPGHQRVQPHCPCPDRSERGCRAR